MFLRPEFRALSLLHLAVAWLGVCLAPPSLSAEPLPRSILVLEQSDVRGPFYGAIYSGLQSEVNASATSPISTYIESAEGPLELPLVHRDLAFHLTAGHAADTAQLERLTLVTRAGFILLIDEVAAWVGAFAGGT